MGGSSGNWWAGGKECTNFIMVTCRWVELGRRWAGGPPRVYRHQNNHSISPPWAHNIQTHPSQTHQNSEKNGQEIFRSKIIRIIRQFSQDDPSIFKERSIFKSCTLGSGCYRSKAFNFRTRGVYDRRSALSPYQIMLLVKNNNYNS